MSEEKSVDNKNLEGKVDIMSTIKPIQATPVLSGDDAINLMQQVFKKPSNAVIRKNEMLKNVLNNIKR